MRFKPIRWADMPMSARKFYVRVNRMFPHTDGRIRGWETFSEAGKTFAVARDGRWYVS